MHEREGKQQPHRFVDTTGVRIQAVARTLKSYNQELVLVDKLFKLGRIGKHEYEEKKRRIRENVQWTRSQISMGQGSRPPISRPGRWDHTWLVDLRYFLPPHYRESFRGDINEIARELDLNGYGRLRRFAILAMHSASVIWAAIKFRLSKVYRRKS